LLALNKENPKGDGEEARGRGPPASSRRNKRRLGANREGKEFRGVVKKRRGYTLLIHQRRRAVS